jgi:CheY-like chemotaxis protein
MLATRSSITPDHPNPVMSSVLIVDSDSELRRFVAFLLTSAGHRVREAAEIRAAAALLREAPADLLLMDLTQSSAHATETLEAIRRDFSSLEVVALAGLSHAAGCLRLCTALGGPRTPDQPFTKREIMAFVTEMMAGVGAHVAHAQYRRQREISPRTRA